MLKDATVLINNIQGGKSNGGSTVQGRSQAAYLRAGVGEKVRGHKAHDLEPEAYLRQLRPRSGFRRKSLQSGSCQPDRIHVRRVMQPHDISGCKQAVMDDRSHFNKVAGLINVQ